MLFNYLETVVMKHWLPLLIGFFGTIPWWARSLLSEQLQAKVDEYLNPLVTKWIGIVAILISFVLANFFSWKDEHEKVSDLSLKLNRIAAESNPNITGTIERVIIGQERAPEKRLSVDITASLRNIGAPSVAEGFVLKVNFTNGQVISGEKAFPWNSKKETHYGSGLIETVSATDLLDQKASQPIPNGGMIRGRLFYLIDASVESITVPGTIYELIFYDILGKQIIAKVAPEFTNAEPIKAYPGLDFPILTNFPKIKP